MRRGPFHLAFDRLAHERSDIRRAGLSGQDLVDGLRLYRRRDPGQAVRVLIVGDSSSLTLGYGLERWGNDTGRATVWSAGVEACGLASDGFALDAAGREMRYDARCLEVASTWPEQIDAFDPDVVLVLSTRFDLAPRRLDSWDEFKSPGDPEYDDYLVDTYVGVYDALSAGGARVVWLRNPCPPDTDVTPFGRETRPLRNDTVVHVNDVVLGRVAEQRPDLRFFDLYGVLCPEGHYQEGLGEVEKMRPDGVHFSPEGSVWLADRYGDQLLQTALG